MKVLNVSVAIVASFGLMGSAFAVWKVDKAHSSVNFAIRHLVSKTTGQFKEFKGDFNFDEKKPENSKVTFNIDTNSIDTANAKRDEHLRAPDFFDTAKFPEIKFESTKVTSVGGKKYLLVGNITMHGVTKPATFNMEYMGTVKGMDGQPTNGFAATTTLNRNDFGLKWNKIIEGTSVVGDEVEVTLNIAGEQLGIATKTETKPK